MHGSFSRLSDPCLADAIARAFTSRSARPEDLGGAPVCVARRFLPSVVITFLTLGAATTILTSPATAAQALVESITPRDALVQVLRLGDITQEPAQVGAELLPGDQLIGERAQVGVRCPVAEGPVFVFTGGFRLMIDVPNDSGCTVDLLAGTVDVITDEPTEVHAGGVTLGSKGTAYSAAVRRDRQMQLSVYEGTVVAQSDRLAPVPTQAGNTLVWNPAAVAVSLMPNTEETVSRASRVLGSYDAWQAAQMRPEEVDVRTLSNRLGTLYFRVLWNAQDTTSRIELARTQATYSLNDKAVYNLKRAAVTDTAQIRRYDIDPDLLRRGLSTKNEAYYEATFIARVNRGVVLYPAVIASLQPDLTVEATGPTTARAGQDVGTQLAITVRNIGQRLAPGTTSAGNRGYMIDLVLSPDSQLNTGFSVYSSTYRPNVLLQGGRYSNTNDVPARGMWSPGRSSAIIPSDTPAGRYCLGVVVDPARAVSEANETNNTYCVWIRVTR